MNKTFRQQYEEFLGRTLTAEDEETYQSFRRGLIVVLHLDDQTQATPEEVKLARSALKALCPELSQKV